MLNDCAHPSGCRCERLLLEQVPCGETTMALCRAALRVRDGRMVRGAMTHVFPELLNELGKDGYVLARVKPGKPLCTCGAGSGPQPMCPHDDDCPRA